MSDEAERRKAAIERFTHTVQGAVAQHADHAHDVNQKAASFVPIKAGNELNRFVNTCVGNTIKIGTAWLELGLSWINPRPQPAPTDPVATVKIDVDCGKEQWQVRRKGLVRIGDLDPVVVKPSQVSVQPTTVGPGKQQVTITIRTKGLKPGFYRGLLTLDGKPFDYEAYLDPHFEHAATIKGP